MDAFMAFVSIVAIIAIVVVAGGLIAFIAHMIIGAFDNEKRNTIQPKEVIDYAEYKKLENPKDSAKEVTVEETIDQTKVEEEKVQAEETKVDEFDIVDEKIEDDTVVEEEIAKIEEELKAEASRDESEDDLDDLLNAISEEVIDEEKENIATEEAPKMSDELASMSIDEYLENMNKTPEDEKEEAVEETKEETLENEEKAEVVEETPVEEEIATEEEIDEDFNFLEDVMVEEEIEEVEEKSEESEDVEETKESHEEEIARLKAELADLNKKLADATSGKVEVVTINATEEECVARLEILEERLKNVKKDYKINMKEYRPLKKIMNEYERNLTKLRRKDAMVAKKKVALYGVNNYVDIDKEKAEKLSNELELLNGLRLSVSHCEEIINANKDRYPILEHTNKILEDQITHIEADILATQETLKKLRDNNGEGSSENN